MNVDELPLEVLAVLAFSAWCLLGVVSLFQFKWYRRDDLDARVAAHNVVAHRMEHSQADDDVEGEEPEHSADEPAHDDEDVHARILPIYLPPGIPSVSERLDRWKELS